MDVSEWLPDQPIRIGRSDWPQEADDSRYLRLRVGHIVVIDRQPWRVLEINPYLGPWPKSYEKAWRDHVELWKHSESLHRANGQPTTVPPERADFYKRPMVLVLRNENLPRSAAKHWCAPASHDWQVLPEHYAVCRACGELPPCHNGEYRWEGGPRRPEQNGGVTLIVPPDCCMGCAEHIKSRMRTVRFPGPNLWYPDLDEGSAVFHARTACADQLECYRMQWAAEYVPPMSQPTFALGLSDGENFTLPRTRRSEPAKPTPTDWNRPTADGAELHRTESSGVRPEPSANGGGAFEQTPPFHRAPASRPAFETPRTNLASADDSTGLSTTPVHQSSVHQSPAHQGQAHQSPSHQSQTRQSPARQSQAHQAPSHQSPTDYRESVDYQGSTVRPGARMHHPFPLDAPPSEQPSRPAPSADVAPPMISVQNIEAVSRLTEELDLSRIDRSAFHNADQAAKAIEELTAAVRNIALCLSGTDIRTRP